MSDGRDRRSSDQGKNRNDDTPKLYSIFQGEVARIQPYGIFVRIPGSRKQGLVHKTQMSNVRIEKPEEVVELSESVFCKVISVDTNEEGYVKVGLSMKNVNQSTGKDMDPNHVQTSLDEQRRKTAHKKEIPRIELGAVLDTTCKKCGGKGHFAQDCFQTGEKSYDLLPDVDYMMDQAKSEITPDNVVKKEKKKRKKEKKHKKKKHKSHSSDDSDSDEPKSKRGKRERHEHRRQESSSEESDHRSHHHKKSKKRKHSRSDR